MGTYEAGDGARKSIVKYICDPSIDPPHTSVRGEKELATYYFSIVLKYACASSAPTPQANCTQLDQCSCRFDDGRGLVDLTELGKHGTPLISDEKAGVFYYSFNPCFSFYEGTCQEVAGCQLENTTGYIDIAAAFPVSLIYDGSNIVGNYTSSDGSRNTIVTFVCDQAIDTPITIVNGEVCLKTYGFTIVSKDICQKKEPFHSSNVSAKVAPFA